MCMSMKTPDVPAVVPLAKPTSEQMRKKEDQERELRARMAGVRNDIVTSPMGIPASAKLGVAA